MRKVAFVSSPCQLITVAPGVTARVLAVARVVVPATDLPSLRARLAEAFAARLPASVVKQCDELTAVGLETVRRAATGLPAPTTDWGVVVCPRAPGRRRMAEVITTFRERGAWAVTPHFIPHSLLHSAAGLIGQALGLHGPGAGVGGTAGSEEDVFRVAAGWLAGGDMPGTWLVWAGWTHETLGNEQVTAVGLAAAVVPADAVATGSEPMRSIERLAVETRSD